MLKASCPKCGYPVRLARSWLRASGPPLCPEGHGSLESPEWDAIAEAEVESWGAEMEAWEAEALAVDAPRVLRDRWVDTRAPHDCDRCRETVPHPDRMRHRVMIDGGALRSTYTCLRCDGAGNSSRERGVALAGA